MKRKSKSILIIIIVAIVACAAGLIIFFSCRGSNNKPESPIEEPETVVSEELLRTFSTNPDSYNVITRYGNTQEYLRSTYNYLYNTTDRQSTGIAAMSGDTITVYVEADETDPLPYICFTQYVSYYANWIKTYPLTIGENKFVVPEFGFYNNASTYYYSRVDNTDVYKTLYHGGPIYLLNQYTEAEQSSNVKITISGGECFPIFRDGGDEKTYKAQLKAYVKKVNAHPEKYLDITEIEMKHNLMTVWATRSYNESYGGDVSVQVNVNIWNDYMKRLFSFNGMEFDETSQNYNELIEHIRINFRQAQNSNSGDLYAYNEYIGWCWNAGTACFNFNYDNLITHEIGHIVDVRGRNINEVTNEVVCGWGDYIYVGNKTTSQEISDIFATSTNETNLSKNWYKYQPYGVYEMLWFLPCGSDVDTWGRFNKLYTSEETGQSLGYVEKTVYYWSLASGADSSEYFERCGFYYSGDPVFNSTSSRFVFENASEEFKTLMTDAKAAGRIGDAKKWWYYDASQFNYIHNYGENIASWGSLYTSSSKVQIKNIFKSSNGYMLLLPEPTNSTAHLGYEILEFTDGNWSVIGFTYNTQFEDTTAYEADYIPTYKVRAYDRTLSFTALSDEKQYTPTTAENVCRIGQTYYNSLSEAVSQADADSTIYICGDLYASGIIINKNLTILADSPITITKDCPGDMFTITSGTVTFGDNQNSLTLDGGSFIQTGSLISCTSSTTTVNLNNVILRNNRNLGNGGAVALSTKAIVNISGSKIYNNTASNGGGVYNYAATAKLTNTEVYSNIATNCAGGLGSFKGGVLTANSCTITNNIAAFGGGVANEASTTLTNCTITENSATYGGGIHLVPDTYSRTVSIAGGTIANNTATSGGSLAYIGVTGSLIGTLNFTNSSTILEGEFLKATNASINFSAGILDLSNVTFAFESFLDNSTLATCANLTEEQLNNFRVAHDGQLSRSGNNVIFNFSGVQLTVKYSYTSYVKSISLRVNENYTLPQTLNGLDENVYIKEYRTADGTVYQIGETVNINDVNNYLIAVVADKFRVTVNYVDHTETLYVMYGEKLDLSSLSSDSEGTPISGWRVDDKVEELDAIIQISKDTYINAVYSA